MHNLLLAEDPAAIIAVGGAFAVAIIAIIFSSIRQMVRSKHREESRREIAAYIAEGSMTADEGERLMNAGEDKKKDDDD